MKLANRSESSTVVPQGNIRVFRFRFFAHRMNTLMNTTVVQQQCTQRLLLLLYKHTRSLVNHPNTHVVRPQSTSRRPCTTPLPLTALERTHQNTYGTDFQVPKHIPRRVDVALKVQHRRGVCWEAHTKAGRIWFLPSGYHPGRI